MPLEFFDARRDVRNLFITPEIRNRIMQVQPGETTSGHTHDLGHETFIVLDGEAEFTIAGESALLEPGQVCVARAGQWHTIRCIGDKPMTMYLSVTPHIEPTHTLWDREGGQRLPYRFGDSTRAERNASSEPPVAPEQLLERHVAASAALGEAAQANAAAQAAAAADLRAALSNGDTAATYAAVDAMWRSFYAMYTRLQASELAWNQVATLAAPG
jgi:quercetin dioxygenase-like cupin family protein